MNNLLAWGLARARQQTLSLVRDLAEEQMCLQRVPGEHHAGWIVGHLLLGDNYLLSLLGVRDLPDDFAVLLERYGPGEAPSSDRDRYGATGPLVARLTSTGELRDVAVRRMTREDLDRPTPDAGLASSQPTVGHHLEALVCHEGYHAGELAAWRRGHGLAPTRWAFAGSPS